MIDPELLPEFVAEAGEHLDEMEANLIKLEADPENRGDTQRYLQRRPHHKRFLGVSGIESNK